MAVGVTMQEDSGSLQHSLSVLDRLLLTHSIWLQLSINTDSTLHILQREPVGTFLVCKCASTQRKTLCVKVQEDNASSSVREYPIREEDSTFSLVSSALSFPDLCRLVAFYCVSRDVLPFPLELPEAIAQASTHSHLETISHLGLEFWSSQACPNTPNGPPQQDPSGPTGSSKGNSCRPAGSRRSGKGSPCFINPLFLQQQPPSRGATHKRHRFKRSLRVRVSMETSLSLSSGPSSPAPEGLRPGRKTTGVGLLKRTPALSPTSEEEDDQMPENLPLVSAPEDEEVKEESCSVEEACTALEKRRAPSLAELDSNSSFSSLEEEAQEEVQPAVSRASLTRGASSPAGPASSLRRMSSAFVCFFAPERRVARLVEDLARDRRSAFGSLVQDFLRQQREEMKAQSWSSAVGLLQGLRLFLSQAKRLLLESGEMEPPIETLVPENEKDLALEKALFGCVLKPLKGQLDQTLLSLHTLDGSLQRVSDSLQACQEGAQERLGVRVGILDAQGIERAKKKLTLMQRIHSPIDKVLLLLQVCKSVYKAMGKNPDQEVGSEDFLPALSYAIVKCNVPRLLLEVEYMMELLEQSWLTGEGGYYLTSVYASLCLIQNRPEAPPSSTLTRDVQESLREWSQRRGQEAKTQKEAQQSQRFVRVLFQDGDRTAIRTLQWKAGENAETFTCSCAAMFGVTHPEHYSLFWRNDGEMRPLPPHATPQDLANHSEGATSLSYLRSDHDFSKMRRLTRGGAVDLGESVCEE
ncbi:ras and Rab interactor 2 [Chanos chanos]|uniref:Ras and Rab interactor 2 n=1 Tax=Chanos chanos TaxID=29144 RepID=A0A6J2VTC5_CHACN|nr:ras and Rab interactor 2-like [Chanos chanos]